MVMHCDALVMDRKRYRNALFTITFTNVLTKTSWHSKEALHDFIKKPLILKIMEMRWGKGVTEM